MSPFARTRGKQVVRVLSMVAKLQRSYYSVPQLARTLRVSRRTIQRDLNALRHARVGLLTDGHLYTIG